MPNHLIIIGAILWAIAILSLINCDRNESSYAKGFQVRLIDKQWRV